MGFGDHLAPVPSKNKFKIFNRFGSHKRFFNDDSIFSIGNIVCGVRDSCWLLKFDWPHNVGGAGRIDKVGGGKPITTGGRP